ncbi:unnamed protein product, partial [Chrysoparadoxa australica]
VHRGDLLNPDPLQYPPRDAAARRVVESGAVEVMGERVQLTQQQVQELLKLSDELDLNEQESLNIWALVSPLEERRLLEVQS